MLIRYGFNIEIDVWQETTILTALDIEPARRRDIVEERPFTATSVVSIQQYTDGFGNTCRPYRRTAGDDIDVARRRHP
jgi:hypothetical protein